MVNSVRNSFCFPLFVLVMMMCLTSFVPLTYASESPLEERLFVANELPNMQLHELMSLEVTSSSKKGRKLSEVSSAVFVITQEDIRRSGVTSIPEALRMAPGILVSRVDSNKWAISSRSFNSLYANKLLVLIDGRSVFNTLYSAVLWTTQDTLLEDVDRIEVIRGPAAALWGSNAVNGVINVITRNSQATSGGMLSGGTGSEERGFFNWRYGNKTSEKRAWRVFGKHFSRDAARTSDNRASADDWLMHRTGFRYDQRINTHTVKLSGDLFKGRAGLTGDSIPQAVVSDDTRISGGNLLLHWKQQDRFGHATQLKAYYDYERRHDFLLKESRRVFDIDFQDEFSLGANSILWGGGYRMTDSRARGSAKYSLSSERRHEPIYNLFAQNDLTLMTGQVVVTLGSKFEHNPYTQWEVQPNLRLLVVPNEHNSLWAAVSRVARTPGRLERESQIAINGGSTLLGNPSFDAEKVTAYELGYRCSPSSELNFDAAIFYNKYSQLRNFEIVSGPPIVGIFDNNSEGITRGAEVAVNWLLSNRLRTIFSGTYIHVAFNHRDAGASAQAQQWAKEEGEKTPSYHGYLRIDYDPTDTIEIGTTCRYASRMYRDDISEYYGLDVRIAWILDKGLTVELIGQNLLDDHRQEFPRESVFSVYPSEIERSGYVKATYLW